MHKTTQKALPSWVPDFERNDLTLNICENSPWHNIFFFNAAGKTTAECSIDSKTRHISIKAILLDSIVAATTPCPDLGERFRKWLAFILLHQAGLDDRQTSVQQAFFRAIIQDHLWRGIDSPQFLRTHLEFNYFQRAAGFLIAVRYVNEDKDLPSFDSEPRLISRPQSDPETKQILATWFCNPPWKQEGCYHSDEPPEVEVFLGNPQSPSRLQWPKGLSINGEDNHETNLTFFRAAMGSTESRILFVTRNGYIGLGCQDLEVGDQILVPFGCSVPIIVRKNRENFKIVGDAYVSGIMQGELIKNGYSFCQVDEFVLE
jgi:hypothetical protein